MSKVLSDFLESAPAFRAIELPSGAALLTSTDKWGLRSESVTTPTIRLFCEKDDVVLSFDPDDPSPFPHFAFHRPPQVRAPVKTYVHLHYKCRHCGSAKTYSLVVEATPDRTEIMKLGEFPPFGAELSERVQNLLSKPDQDLYRMGLRAEAAGLGIGAASYFRRIVESQWKLLVQELRDAAVKLGETDVAVFDRALAETQFSGAVKQLEDALPAKLRILDGLNPLTLLHRPLSKQLHSLTDAQCLQQAKDIRLVLHEMLSAVADAITERKELAEAANRLRQTTESNS